MSTTEQKGIRPCKAITELATLYGVSTKTLRNWMRPHQGAIGERVSRYYTALQMQVIFDRLGSPPAMD